MPGSLTFRAKGEAVDVAAVPLRVTGMGRTARARSPAARARRPAQRRVSAKTVLTLPTPGSQTVAELHEQVRDLVGLMAAIHTLQAQGKVVLVGDRVIRMAQGVVPTDPALLLRVLAKHGKTMAPPNRQKKTARAPPKAPLPPPINPRLQPVTPESVEPGTWSEIVGRARERIAQQHPTPP
jgi:hypothetical protein